MQEFMRNALVAGTFVGLAAGLAGWFVVLRAQVFAGDALGHVAFTGALGAAAAGIDARAGIFAATILAGAALGGLGERARADDVVIGSLFAWTLGLGVLFLSIFARSGGANGAEAVRVLFGTILGLSAAEVRAAVALGLLACALVLAIARPLLLASLDPSVAAARGVRVRLLDVLFLAAVGLVAAEATQAVGALLLLGLLAAPAGAAHRLTARPYLGLALSGGIAVGSVWLGLALVACVPALPPSTAIVAVAVSAYLAAAAPALLAVARRPPRRPYAASAARARANASTASETSAGE
jgi:zinc/manganese transport system permease protein